MRFAIIYADPPWPYTGRAATDHYPYMSMEDICTLPVQQVAADNCLCLLWCTSPYVAMGRHVRVLEAWGFAPITLVLVWIKTSSGKWRSAGKAVADFVRQPHLPLLYTDEPVRWLLEEQTMGELTAPGPGYYTFSSAEYVVLGRKGGLPKRHKDPATGKQRIAKQAIFAPRRGHSVKPDEAYKRIEWMYPHLVPRLEMFGTEAREGWTVIGNEAPGCEGEDIRDSLERLAEGDRCEGISVLCREGNTGAGAKG